MHLVELFRAYLHAFSETSCQIASKNPAGIPVVQLDGTQTHHFHALPFKQGRPDHIFALLWQLRKRNWPDGLLFLVYLSLYSVMRFSLAFTSSYQIIAFGLTQSQIIALVVLLMALPILVRMQLRRHKLTV